MNTSKLIIIFLVLSVFTFLIIGYTIDLASFNNFNLSGKIFDLYSRSNESFYRSTEAIESARGTLESGGGLSQLTMFLVTGAYNAFRLVINSVANSFSLISAFGSLINLPPIVITLIISIIVITVILLIVRLLSGGREV